MPVQVPLPVSPQSWSCSHSCVHPLCTPKKGHASQSAWYWRRVGAGPSPNCAHMRLLLCALQAIWQNHARHARSAFRRIGAQNMARTGCGGNRGRARLLWLQQRQRLLKVATKRLCVHTNKWGLGTGQPAPPRQPGRSCSTEPHVTVAGVDASRPGLPGIGAGATATLVNEVVKKNLERPAARRTCGALLPRRWR